MSLIVQKFGGSSVSNYKKLTHVAKIVTNTFQVGNDVVVVVSAQGDTTDNLIEKAKKINKNPSKRELDLLLSTGEIKSATFLALIIQNMGYEAIALTGFQAGFFTCDTFGNAKIKLLKPKRITDEINKKNIVIVAGFQGITETGDITTLGRGGSDASAIKIAASLGADECKIFTDVDGVFTSDPNVVKVAKKIEKLSFDEMIFMSFLGAQVMNTRAVQIAKKYKVKFEVLSNTNKICGTIIDDFEENKLNFCSIAIDKHINKISINGKLDVKKLLEKLMKIGIRPDMLKETCSKKNNVLFTVNEIFSNETIEIIKNQQKNIEVTLNRNVAKVSIIGSKFEQYNDLEEKFINELKRMTCKIHYFVKDSHRISAIITKNNIDLDNININLHKKFFEQ